MADLKAYKCPNCGGPMHFDSTLQKMKCPYCESTFDMHIFEEEPAPKMKRRNNIPVWNLSDKAQWSDDEANGMLVYTCQSCGGQVIGDAVTGAAKCPYCGNNVIMKEQFIGDLRPDYVIPFTVTKEDAIQSLKKHIKAFKFYPRAFTLQENLEEVKGIYVPFWLFDADARFDLHFEGSRLARHWHKGDYDYEEFQYYDIQKAGSLAFKNVPIDASSKMEDELMEALEPFDMRGMVDFKTAYLAGYLADRYDVPENVSIARADARTKETVREDIQRRIRNFGNVTYRGGTVDMYNGFAKYTLIPVWYMTVTWQGERYVFAVNGQTGKAAGRIPYDRKTFLPFVLKRALIYAPILILLMNIFFYFV